MAHLKDIYVYTQSNGDKELRLLWDNDRHQGVKIDFTDADSVIVSAERLLRLLLTEKSEGNI